MEARKERTFCMIKPDGVQRGLIGAIIKKFEDKGLKIVALKLVQPDRAHFEKHYEEHIGKSFFEGLITFITSGPVVAIALEGDKAVERVRKMMGPTKPIDAPPCTIRGDYCIDVGHNVVHGSDSVTSAQRELNHWFLEYEYVDWNMTKAIWIYE